MKYSKIIVPLDGSKLAEAVLPYARLIGTAMHLPVDLIHVSDRETESPSLHPTRAADYLSHAAASFLSGLPVHYAVKTGATAEVILDTAATDPGSLIAMATHGQTGGERWILGRVAQKALQASANPMLIIRPQEGASPSRDVRLKTIVVPLDGSHLAAQIFPYVIDLAAGLNLQVGLMRTYMLPTASYFLGGHVSVPDMTELQEKIKKEADDYLAAEVRELRTKGLTDVSSVAIEGSGPEEIINLARRTPDAMVAMTTHGRSGIGRWILGSVADRVVSYCGEPVLIIRPRLEEPRS